MLVDVLSMMYMQDLNGLRAIENDLRSVMAKTVDPFEKNTIQGHIVLIETKKSELKKQPRPQWSKSSPEPLPVYRYR